MSEFDLFAQELLEKQKLKKTTTRARQEAD